MAMEPQELPPPPIVTYEWFVVTSQAWHYLAMGADDTHMDGYVNDHQKAVMVKNKEIKLF